MKIVGRHPQYSAFEPDPQAAYRRGRRLDAMLRAAAIPFARGVTRGTPEDFARADAARMRVAARRLNDS